MTVLVQGSQTYPMTQTWTEITLEVDKDEAEAWADALLEAGALSVQAEDADADSPDEQPLFGEPVPAGLPGTGDGYLPQTFGWKRTRLAVLFDGSEAQSAGAPNPPAATGTPETASTAAPASIAVLPGHILAVLDEAATALQKPLPAVLATRRVDDQDWVRITQAQFDPIPVGQRLLILPSWHAAEAHAFLPYPDDLKQRLLALQPAGQNELHRSQILAQQLSHIYAQTVHQLLAHSQMQPENITAIGCHGQTIRHAPEHQYSIQLVNLPLLAEASLPLAIFAAETLPQAGKARHSFPRSTKPCLPAQPKPAWYSTSAASPTSACSPPTSPPSASTQAQATCC